MNTQTEAQQIADKLEEEATFDIHHEAKTCMTKAAAELRRLEEVSTYFQESYGQELKTSNELRKANAEILLALKMNAQALSWLSFGECRGFTETMPTAIEATGAARAAIAKHGGEAMEKEHDRQGVPALTDDWITQHSMLGADCAGASTVVLASSLRRLLAAAPQQQEPVGWIDAKALEELEKQEMNWMPVWNRQNGISPIALYTSPQAAQPLAETQSDALNTLCKMLHSGEEVEGDDGLAMLVPMDLWNEAQDAIELLIGEDDGTEAAHGITKGTT